MTGNFTGPLEDRIAIRELWETYADATYRGDAETWASIWTEDAWWDFPHLPAIGTVRGRDALVALWRQAGDTYRNISVTVTPGAIRVDGDEAEGRAYVAEIYVDGEGRTRHGRPTYRDRLVRRDGRWLIASRISYPRHYD